MNLVRLLLLLFLIYICIYTFSYGVWTWKKKNITGALMVILLGLSALLLPMYMIFFRT